jgi:hypothetical protein
MSQTTEQMVPKRPVSEFIDETFQSGTMRGNVDKAVMTRAVKISEALFPAGENDDERRAMEYRMVGCDLACQAYPCHQSKTRRNQVAQGVSRQAMANRLKAMAMARLK